MAFRDRWIEFSQTAKRHPYLYLGGLGTAAIASSPRARGWLGNLLGGKKGGYETTPRFNEEQLGLLSQLGQQGMQNLDFSGLEKQALQNFQQNIVPSLAERFTSMGEGAQRSSGFQQALGEAGAQIPLGLAALRPQYGLQQLGLGLQQPFETAYQPDQPGLLSQLLSLIPYAGKAFLGGGF